MAAVRLTHVDTHVLAWLQGGEHRRFPPAVIRRLENDRIVISPIVEMELQILFELGRLTE